MFYNSERICRKNYKSFGLDGCLSDLSKTGRRTSRQRFPVKSKTTEIEPMTPQSLADLIVYSDKPESLPGFHSDRLGLPPDLPNTNGSTTGL
jgi:hypothetical protein